MTRSHHQKHRVTFSLHLSGNLCSTWFQLSERNSAVITRKNSSASKLLKESRCKKPGSREREREYSGRLSCVCHWKSTLRTPTEKKANDISYNNIVWWYLGFPYIVLLICHLAETDTNQMWVICYLFFFISWRLQTWILVIKTQKVTSHFLSRSHIEKAIMADLDFPLREDYVIVFGLIWIQITKRWCSYLQIRIL